VLLDLVQIVGARGTGAGHEQEKRAEKNDAHRIRHQ
jgi:hypothetical protein